MEFLYLVFAFMWLIAFVAVLSIDRTLRKILQELHSQRRSG